MRCIAALFVLQVMFPAFLGAQTPQPERTVTENVITSARNPKLQIALPIQASYLGADRWILYQVADCEIHVFVEADAQKVVQRMYWVQFEGFLRSKPDLAYSYASDPVSQLEGLAFHVKARFGPTDDDVKTGSDAEHVRQLIRRAGYSMPPGMMNVRLVHIPDEQRRSELMIIYSEDIAPTGFAWSDLMPGGKAAGRWLEIKKDLVTRAKHRIALKKSGEE